MNLLVILNDLDIGGAQNYTISLMNEFVKHGHTIHLCVLSPKMPLMHRLNQQVEVKVWERKSKLDIRVIKNMHQEIKNGKYDGIIASYVLYQMLSTLFICKLPVTIYPIHTTLELKRIDYWLNYILYRLKRRNEVYLTSIDNQTLYLLQSYRLRNGFFSQIYNGVDTDKFALPPIEFDRETFLVSKGINPSHLLILMVAGFREEKRHIDAIDAFRLMQAQKNDVSLVFVGDNRTEECNRLLNYASNKNIKDIHFFTADVAGEVRNYYWSSAIFTLTSNKVETFPISALEALSSGLPCVLTKVGGANNFIKENVNGFIVNAEDPESICKGWINCLDFISPEKSFLIRNDIIKKYSIKESAQNYIRLIENYHVK